jgi:transketolase
MTVVAVCDAPEMIRLMERTLDWPKPIYIRMGKGGDPVVSRAELGFDIGRAIPMRKPRGRDGVALMATGVMTTNCLAAAELLERDGIDASVLHVHTVKPLDAESVLEHAEPARLVVTVEEGIAIGGFGSAVTDLLVAECGRSMPAMLRLALPDAFPKTYGVQSDHFEIFGLTPPQIAAAVQQALAREGGA